MERAFRAGLARCPPLRSPQITRSWHRGAAFSLVEVVLTIGVLSFALVGLIGLLSAGMTNFRSSVDLATGAQISQRVIADVQQVEFDTLLEASAGTTGPFFILPPRSFDEQGNEVSPAMPEQPSADERRRILYQVRTRVAKPGAANLSTQSESGFTSLPGDGSACRFQPRDTVFLTIQVVHNPGNRPLPTNGELLWALPAAERQNHALTTYSAVITRNGYQRP